MRTMRQSVDDRHRVVRVQDVAAAVELYAGPELALEGDVIGLQVGNPEKSVKRVLLALDPHPDVIRQAVTAGADMLITHHALLYHPLRQINTATATGRALAVALSHDLAIFNAHTNLDIAEGGVNDVLAALIDLEDVEILDPLYHEAMRKLVVFVPTGHQEAVMDALFSAGAGHVGHYSHCSFSADGVGTFRPLSGAHPYLGEPGQLIRADEVRVETIVPASRLSAVVQAMRDVHPYEEVAYDVYPTEILGKVSGIGRIGNLAQSLPLSTFADTVRERLGLRHVRFGGLPSTLVQRVAVVGGAGGKWAHKARNLGAEVLITSDVGHHDVSDAWQTGLAMIDATHAALEKPVMERLAAHLRVTFGDAVDVQMTTVEEDPFTWI